MGDYQRCNGSKVFIPEEDREKIEAIEAACKESTGFYPVYNEHKDLVGIEFEYGKARYEDDSAFAKAIAPHMPDWSYIEMITECGDETPWRWVFYQGNVTEEYPELVWYYENFRGSLKEREVFVVRGDDSLVKRVNKCISGVSDGITEDTNFPRHVERILLQYYKVTGDWWATWMTHCVDGCVTEWRNPAALKERVVTLDVGKGILSEATKSKLQKLIQEGEVFNGRNPS